MKNKDRYRLNTAIQTKHNIKEIKYRILAVLLIFFAVLFVWMPVNSMATGLDEIQNITNGVVYSIAVDTTNIYIGGDFTRIDDSVNKNRIAAINKTTGEPVNNWDPDANGRIDTMILSGDVLYVGGEFTLIDNQTRNRIAAINKISGEPIDNWDPDVNGRIDTMVLSGDVLYVGGEFTLIDNQTRNRIAAINKTTGELIDDMILSADNNVSAMLLKGTTLYVGGAFNNLGGETRNSLAAIDTLSNNVTSWNPGVSNSAGTSAVNALAIYDTTIYVGGSFDHIGGSDRNNIAALDTTTNTENATSWAPEADASVLTMLRSGSTLYVGGTFTAIGDGTSYTNYAVASLDIARDTNITRTWNPNLNNDLSTTSVYSLALDNGKFYVGGDFNQIGDLSGGNLARFNFTAPVTTALIPSGTYPKEQFVTLSCKPADGFECDRTYYTLDGSEPTPFSDVALYGGAYIDSSATLKFFSIDNAGAVGTVNTESYEIELEDVVCFIDTAGQ